MTRLRGGRRVAVALLLLTTGCGSSSAGDDEIVVGYLPITTALPLFVADAEGFFDDEGLDVTFRRFDSSPIAGTAFASHEIDAVASIATASALAIEARDPGIMRIFAVDAEAPPNCLSSIVTSDASVTDVSDLRGRTVGIFPGPTARTFFELVLERHGLNADRDLQLVELAPSLQVPALESGQVDALATYDPIATQATLQGATVVRSCAIERDVMSPWQAGSWILDAQLVEDRPEAARGFTKALTRAFAVIARAPGEARLLFPEFMGIDHRVADAIPLIPVTTAEDTDFATLSEHVEILINRGILGANSDLDVEALFWP